ncbi:MAG TPA: cysteine rich repeat-containing protein [Acidimicrobiales bacterium]|nr:cysteine rich repeat-containing protein [Acidimicrobiales bacterium]
MKAKRLVEEFGRSCRADVDQFCAGVDPGGGRIIGCLNQHQPELSSSCQAEMSRLAKARERVSALRTACKADAERVCKGVPAKAGPLLECLQANEENLSAECNPEDIRRAVEAASVVDVVEEMSSQEHIRESLQILQGLDSVAFSRSQILLQFDSYQALQDKANGGRMLFNPQFVFGHRNEFAFQVKMPVTTLYPYAAGAPTQFGLGAVSTALAWNFLGEGRVRQYLAMGLQVQTASTPAIGGPWAVVSSYAIGAALQRWLSITTQVQWTRSIGSSSSYPELNLFYVGPSWRRLFRAGRTSRWTPGSAGTSSGAPSFRS